MKSLRFIARVSQFAPLPRRFRPALVLALVAAVSSVTSVQAQTATSAVPGFFTYQGKVSNANGTLVGAGTPVNRTVIFRIWSHQSNSTVNDLVYSEQQTVTISEGEFSVLIGQGSAVSGTPLGYSEASKGPGSITIASPAVFGGATRFLGLTIDDPATSADPEVSPRQQLVTSAYAFRAKYAESLGSNGLSTLTTLDNGNVGIGTSTPARALDVNSAAVRFANGGNGFEFVQASTTNWVFANVGTANTVGFHQLSVGTTYSGTAAPANGAIVQGNVGIGTTSPASKAHLAVGNTDGLRVESSNSGFLEVGKTGGSRWRMANNYSADAFEILFGASGANPGTSRLAIDTNGNVGLGHTQPSAKLHVGGGIKVDGTHVIELGAGVAGKEGNAGKIGYAAFTSGSLDIVGAGTAATNGSDRKIKFWNEGGAFFNGNVGIGTDSPGARLEVVGGGARFQVIPGQLFGVANSTAITLEYPGFGTIGVWDNFAVSERLGVGISNPTRGRIDVAGGPSMTVGPYGYLNASGGVGHYNATTSSGVSVWADHRVIASEFNAQSDQRIKLVDGRSSGAADLRTLLQIEVTDYRYKDMVARGDTPQKKVLGQQLEKVFPQSVTQRTDVVPDIFAGADFTGNWIELATDLKVGERVKLIAEGSSDIHEVLEVQPGRFRTALAPKGDKVFVYGREVKDFRVVDYDAIAMLNVSATQEIKREVDTLRTANAELTQRLAELESKDRARDAKLAAIEKLISSGQTVMARPASSTSTNASGQE